MKEWEMSGFKLRKPPSTFPARCLSDLTLPDHIEEQVHRARMSPSQIVLEITESAVMADTSRASDILTRLRLKGFGLSMDDFGTG